MPRLLALSYSPWSEKARWALDHHRINYRETEFLPLLGTPLLRLRLRQLGGKVTVPVLFVDGDAITDSYEIARYCDRVGAGVPLFPAEELGEIARFNRLSEKACHAGRALATARVAEDPAAMEEAVPSLIPGPLRRPMGEVGVRYLDFKYALSRKELTEHRGALRQVLDTLGEELGDRQTLLLGFSFADIAMAAALQLVAPVEDRFIRLGRHTRTCMTDPEVVRDYAPLLRWRDALYQAFRAAQ